MISATTQVPTADERGDGLLNYISPTRLNTWLSCALKFKLKYVDRIQEPTSPSLFLGKVVHDGLRYRYQHQQDGLSVTAADISQYMCEAWDGAVINDSMHFDSEEDESALQQQATGLVHAYLDECDTNEGYPIAVESKLECPLVDPDTGENLGTGLLGYVDLVLQSPTGCTIVDFKTAARSSTPLDIAHEIQLSCYAYAFRSIYGETEQELQIRSLIKTKTPRVETHRYPARDQRHFRRLFAVIRAYLYDVRAGRFVYRPSWTCSMCHYRDTHCLAWQG